MPAIVGNISINSVGSSSVVQFGDTAFVSPRSATKSFAGSGSFSTGDFQVINNGLNATNTLDNDLADEAMNKVGAG